MKTYFLTLFFCWMAYGSFGQMNVTLNSTDPRCAGDANGEIQTSVTGAVPPFSYSWSDLPPFSGPATRTGLPAGNYAVTVYDGNFSTFATASVTLVDPPALQITSLQTTDVICKGDSSGTAVAIVTGGVSTTSNLSYTWAAGITGFGLDSVAGLRGGIYNLSVRDFKGCEVNASFTITEPSNILSGTIAATPTTCNNADGSLRGIVQSSGAGGVTYSWNTNPVQNGVSINNLAAGSTYVLTLEDNNGCQFMDTAQVPGSTLAGQLDTTPTTCNNMDGELLFVLLDSATQIASYEWNTMPIQTTAGISGLANGSSYTVTVTDTFNCQLVLTGQVTGPPMLTSTITADNSNFTAQVNPNGGTPPYNYQWSTNANSQTTALATGLAADSTYMVTITDSLGCSTVDTISFLVNINTLSNVEQFILYPNPSQGQFTLDCSFRTIQAGSWELSNTLGQVLRREEFEAPFLQENIQLEEYSKGIYFVTLRIGGQLITRKIRIE